MEENQKNKKRDYVNQKGCLAITGTSTASSKNFVDFYFVEVELSGK
jgi:hypothetical protein